MQERQSHLEILSEQCSMSCEPAWIERPSQHQSESRDAGLCLPTGGLVRPMPAGRPGGNSFQIQRFYRVFSAVAHLRDLMGRLKDQRGQRDLHACPKAKSSAYMKHARLLSRLWLHRSRPLHRGQKTRFTFAYQMAQPGSSGTACRPRPLLAWQQVLSRVF